MVKSGVGDGFDVVLAWMRAKQYVEVREEAEFEKSERKEEKEGVSDE